ARPRVGTTLWVLLVLCAAAVVSRIYTTNSLAGEPTPDEYLYAVQARDLAREWAKGQPLTLEDLGVEGRSVAVESAALSLFVPLDPLTVGRTMQALFNALCIPMTFILARQVGLARSAAAAGALLLMAVPQFQELAWRFWTDSQATFVCLVYLSALLAFGRRPSVVSAALSLLGLGLLLLTKESAAVTFTPFLLIVCGVVAVRRVHGSRRVYTVAAGVLAVLLFIGAAVLLARAPADLKNNALLQKTFGAGPLILTSIRKALPMLPDYSNQLTSLIGPTELGTGFLCATLTGFAFLVAQAVVALVTERRRPNTWVLGCVVAAAVWAVAMVTPTRDLASLRQSDPWVAVAAATLLVVIGTVELYLRNVRPGGWGIALLGLVVIAVLSERLVISVTPAVSNAALTFRSLMPIVPLFAIVGGAGLWAMAGALALLAPSIHTARAGVAVLATLVLVVFWSPLLRERFSTQPLLGRVADRGADADTPQGLRVEAMVEAQSWLQANIRPTDLTIVGVGNIRQLAWYADLGMNGMENLIDLGSHPEWTTAERAQFEMDRAGANGVAYIVDFNVNWMDPDGEASRQWRAVYDNLASQRNLETAYLRRDKFGYPVFYVIRNHGYAVAPGRS
ncbi:MAG: glycosyltransferase family 39 protein, partial [Chloroflexi bacterium]|nr:glycosyltransferase family 39 protein [Chloroflexota bacterium]